MRRRKLPHVLLLSAVIVLLPSGLGAGAQERTGALYPNPNHGPVAYAGLAIGVPGEELDGIGHAGGVNVQHAPPGGLPTFKGTWFAQNLPPIPGSPDQDDEFGRSLVVADLNGDRYADLVIGVPGERVGTEDLAGGLHVLYGQADGLSLSGSQWFDQSHPDIIGSSEATDGFGRALAAGDLNGDGFDDLAVGVPYEDVGTEDNAGGVNVLYGSQTGLAATGQWFDQRNEGVIGTAEAGDGFGAAVAIGDLNGDGYDDLVVGVPNEQVGPEAGAGGVNVLYGTPAGLTTSGSQWFDQNHPGMFGSAEQNDFFGNALAIGDFNCDGRDDLAVGVPFETVGQAAHAGGVNVLYGQAAGLWATGSQWFDQNTSGVIGAAEEDDYFGWALAAGDLNLDGCDDLAIGAPSETVGSESTAGGVNVLYGQATGLQATGSQWFDQRTDGVIGAPEDGDEFGRALAIGDLNADGYADLAIGVPFEDIGGEQDAGGVNLLYGSTSGLTTRGSLWLDQRTDGVFEDPQTDDRFGFSLAIWPRLPSVYVPLALHRSSGER